MICRKPSIRHATNFDSPRIQEMLQANDLWVDGLDWSELSGWFVAEHKSQVVGATQILHGKPCGCIMYITVDPEYIGSGVGLALWQFAKLMLGIKGADAILTFTTNEWIIRKADKLGITLLKDFTATCQRIPNLRGSTINETKHLY